MNLNETPLGHITDYVDTYDASLLCPVPRPLARESLAINDDLPFQGKDLWTVFELSWLNANGKPVVALAQIEVDCASANLVESKSLKLYLNSFANSQFESAEKVAMLIEQDLSACANGNISVQINLLENASLFQLNEFQGLCIDHQDISIDQYEYDASLLSVSTTQVEEQLLVSHLVRSRCPVTGQPDWASVQIRYKGAAIDHEGLLRYVISLRNHQGFHEQIIERIYLDVMNQCQPELLSVYGRFTRRGGIDINPYRSNGWSLNETVRTVRQ